MYFPDEYSHQNGSYQRLHSVATVLERFVASAPNAVRLDQLINASAMKASGLRKLCSNLCEAGLIAATENADHWILVGSPAEVTLEHVWQSVMSDNGSTRKRAIASETHESTDEVGLLISQAFFAINQSIATHLSKFQLDRVSVAQCGIRIPPSWRRSKEQEDLQ